MRITNNMLINNMIRHINNNLDRMSLYQSQIAAGKKISKPSDDPIVASRALKLRTDVSEIKQYIRNVQDAQSWLDTTETALAHIGDVLQRTRELMLEAANGTNTPSDTQKIKEEVVELKKQIIQLSNTTYADRHIFSGFKTDKKLLIDDETSPDFGKFNIDVSMDENIQYEIGVGIFIRINVLGGDLFNMGQPAVSNGTSPDDSTPVLIQHFNELIAALDAGDLEKVNELLNSFDKDIDNVLKLRADVGARTNRLELTEYRLETDLINFAEQMSKNEDVDMAQAIINLRNEENVYRASLAGGAQIIMPTLVDFLR